MKTLSRIVAASSLVTCAAAQAGGLYLYESTTSDIGLASAGMAARAQDASIMQANPAGLAHVAGESFSGSLIGLYGDTVLDTFNGGNAGNVIGLVPMGSAFYSQQVNDKWTLGVGLYGNYGMSLEYDKLFNKIDIPAATTQALTLQPSASYRINDQWSLGAALGLQYGMFKLEAQPVGAASRKKVEDDDVRVNGRVGVLYELDNDTRFGLSYSSEVEFEFRDKNVESSSIMPRQVVLSGYHALNDRLALMGNINWQDWSAYQTLTPGADTRDTYQIALGTQYRFNDKMRWNAGFAFDTSMYDSQSHGDITIPTGKAYRIGMGLDYQLDEIRSLGVAFEAVILDSSSVTLGNGAKVAGFSHPALYFLSMNYNW
ncbi:OmpP1/FadL family transporter [Aeromonas enteropelogenes]|uniref:OmpP1/FadL family transporter n=1 Tax=Aeromonas enteropelogenes TaxID=29489 RepID=UPI003BA022A3